MAPDASRQVFGQLAAVVAGRAAKAHQLGVGRRAPARARGRRERRARVLHEGAKVGGGAGGAEGVEVRSEQKEAAAVGTKKAAGLGGLPRAVEVGW